MRRSGFYIERSGNETLLLRRGGNESIYMNESASLIWGLCDGERTIDDIQGFLVREYPDYDGSISEEVQATVAWLIDHKAVDMVCIDGG